MRPGTARGNTSAAWNKLTPHVSGARSALTSPTTSAVAASAMPWRRSRVAHTTPTRSSRYAVTAIASVTIVPPVFTPRVMPTSTMAAATMSRAGALGCVSVLRFDPPLSPLWLVFPEIASATLIVLAAERFAAGRPKLSRPYRSGGARPTDDQGRRGARGRLDRDGFSRAERQRRRERPHP